MVVYYNQSSSSPLPTESIGIIKLWCIIGAWLHILFYAYKCHWKMCIIAHYYYIFDGRVYDNFEISFNSLRQNANEIALIDEQTIINFTVYTMRVKVYITYRFNCKRLIWDLRPTITTHVWPYFYILPHNVMYFPKYVCKLILLKINQYYSYILLFLK